MQHDVTTLLQDMLYSARLLKEYAATAKNYYAFAANRMLCDAVERRFSIIGEALYKADKLDKALAISDKQKIIGLRHILVHEYDKAEPERLWVLSHKPLDTLIEEVESLLKSS